MSKGDHQNKESPVIFFSQITTFLKNRQIVSIVWLLRSKTFFFPFYMTDGPEIALLINKKSH